MRVLVIEAAGASALARIDPALLAKSGPTGGLAEHRNTRPRTANSLTRPPARTAIGVGGLLGGLDIRDSLQRSRSCEHSRRLSSRCRPYSEDPQFGARRLNCEYHDLLCGQQLSDSPFLPIRQSFSLSLNVCWPNEPQLELAATITAVVTDGPPCCSGTTRR